jgi:hypothetical protein
MSQQPHLNALYDDECQQLSHQYRLQERAQSFFGSDHSNTLTWDSIVLLILTADDFQATAKDLLRRIKPTQNQAPSDAHAFLTALRQAVAAAADAQSSVILYAIDQQLLTVEDLAYYVKLPIEQVQAMVQHLWDAGYIDLARRRLPICVLAFFAPNLPSRLVDRSMTFNLTPKGHFHLHPVKPSQREDTAQ